MSTNWMDKAKRGIEARSSNASIDGDWQDKAKRGLERRGGYTPQPSLTTEDYKDYSAYFKKQLAESLPENKGEFDGKKVRELTKQYAGVQAAIYENNLKNGFTGITPIGENIANLYKAHGYDFQKLFPDLYDTYSTGNVEAFAYQNSDKYKAKVDNKHKSEVDKVLFDLGKTFDEQIKTAEDELAVLEEKQYAMGGKTFGGNPFIRPTSNYSVEDITKWKNEGVDFGEEIASKKAEIESIKAYFTSVSEVFRAKSQPDFEEKNKYVLGMTQDKGESTNSYLPKGFYEKVAKEHNKGKKDLTFSNEDGSTYTVTVDKNGLTDDEYGTLMYILNTQGVEAADKFYEGLEFNRNSNIAQSVHDTFQEMEKGGLFQKMGAGIGETAYALASGVKGLITAPINMVADMTGVGSGYYAPSVSQQITAKNIESADGVGRIGLQAVQATPQIIGVVAAAKYGGPRAANAFLAATVFPSSYVDAKNRGASEGQALSKAGLDTALEIATEKFLGNTIEGSGTTFTGLVGSAAKKTNIGAKVYDFFSDVASKYPSVGTGLRLVGKSSGSGISEMAEEYTTSFFSPYVENIVYGTTKKAELWNEEEKESSAVGFITGLILGEARNVNLYSYIANGDYGARIAEIYSLSDKAVTADYLKSIDVSTLTEIARYENADFDSLTEQEQSERVSRVRSRIENGITPEEARTKLLEEEMLRASIVGMEDLAKQGHTYEKASNMLRKQGVDVNKYSEFAKQAYEIGEQKKPLMPEIPPVAAEMARDGKSSSEIADTLVSIGRESNAERAIRTANAAKNKVFSETLTPEMTVAQRQKAMQDRIVTENKAEEEYFAEKYNNTMSEAKEVLGEEFNNAFVSDAVNKISSNLLKSFAEESDTHVSAGRVRNIVLEAIVTRGEVNKENVARQLADAFAMSMPAASKVYQTLVSSGVSATEALTNYALKGEISNTIADKTSFEAIAGQFKAIADSAMTQVSNARTRAFKSSAENGEKEGSNEDNSFSGQIDKWDASGRNSRVFFDLGVPSAPLIEAGIDNKRIHMDSSKVIQIMKDHKEMTLDVIKQIPNIISDPIIILRSKSKNVGNSFVIYGSVTGENGVPVMVSIRTGLKSGINSVEEVNKITSAYTRRNTQNLINTSDVLWVNPDKKRTTNWMYSFGLQLPSATSNDDSSDTIISHDDDGVNTSIHSDTKNDASGKETAEKSDSLTEETKEQIAAKNSVNSDLKKTPESDTMVSESQKTSAANDREEIKRRINELKDKLSAKYGEDAAKEAILFSADVADDAASYASDIIGKKISGNKLLPSCIEAMAADNDVNAADTISEGFSDIFVSANISVEKVHSVIDEARERIVSKRAELESAAPETYNLGDRVDADALAVFDNGAINETSNKGIDNQKIKGETNNVRAEETRYESGTEESSQEVERYDRRGEERSREQVSRRIKEILRRSSFSRNENSLDGRKTARIEQKESAKDFEVRVQSEGCIYRANGKSAIAYKEAPKADWNDNSNECAKVLESLGITVVVFDGDIQSNSGYVTEKSFDGLTFGMGDMTTVFISSELDIDGLETAYHEAFHVLRRGNKYKHHYEMIDIISDGVNVESETFEHFVSAISELYSYNVKNVSLDKFSSEIIEGFYAWYIGKIYGGKSTYDSDMLDWINGFSDADAIKSQLDEVYEKIKVGVGSQVPNTDNSLQLMSETAVQLVEDFGGAVEGVLSVSDNVAKEYADKRVAVEVLKNTPDVILENVEGTKDLKVIINYNKLYLAVRENGVFKGHYHNLGAEIAKRLPEFLKSPDAIIQLANGRLNLFATVATKRGNNGIVTVELNSPKDIDGKYEDYNVVVTMFSSDDNYAKNLLSGDDVSIKYRREDLSQVNPQLYKWLAIVNDKSSVDTIISHDNNIVNTSISEDSELDTSKEENATEEVNFVSEEKAGVAETNEAADNEAKLYTVTKTKHTATGEDIWVVSLNDRISKEEFAKLRDEVKKNGGYYSRFAKTLDGKALPGFVFKSEPSIDVLSAFENDSVPTSPTAYSETEKKNWESSNSIVVYENDDQLDEFINEALDNINLNQKIYFGKIPEVTSQRIFKETGVDVSGYNVSLKKYEIRKILLNSHGDFQKENLRGQTPITPADIKLIPRIISNPDDVRLSKKEYEGKPVLEFEKEIDNKKYVVAYVSRKHHDISVITMYKKRSLATAENANALSFTSETTNSTASTDIIAPKSSDVNTESTNVKENIENEREQTGILGTESEGHTGRNVSEEVQKAEEGRGVGRSDNDGSQNSAREVREDARLAEGEQTSSDRVWHRESDTGRDFDGELREHNDSEGRSDGASYASSRRLNTHNYKITEDIDSKRPNITDNIEAIKLLKSLEESGKKPTKGQQAILARYKGWGGLKNAFTDYYNSRQLKELLTDEEFANARASILNAHYTSTKVIGGIYKGLARLGFKGGNILEPSMGVGNFFGVMPSSISGKTNLYGVEMDSLTGRIAKMLYPDASIEISPFQDVKYPEGSFDAVVGNVPFSEITFPYKGGKYTLHDYFFLKSLDTLKEGGVAMLLTSTGTLDKLNVKARHEIAKRANLIAAFRLPNNAFETNAGTSVTTDLIVLQKRGDTVPFNGVPFEQIGRIGDIPINEYFVNHPENILGELVREKGMYVQERTQVEPLEGDFEKLWNKAISRLPKDLLSGIANDAPIDIQTLNSNKSHFEEKDGKVIFFDSETGKATEQKGKSAERAKVYIAVKDAYNNLLESARNGASKAERDVLRKILSDTYDSFNKKFGFLQDKVNSSLEDDTEFVKVSGLELYNPKTKKFEKSGIFTSDTIGYVKPVKADTSVDALAISINESGRVDFKRMGELVGKSKEEIAAELEGTIIETPDGDFELISTYASGNIREKLKAVEGKEGFEKNVEILKAAMPKDKTPSEIVPQLGASWIEPKYIEDFIKETHNLGNYHYVKVNYDKTNGAWVVDKFFSNMHSMTQKYGTRRADAYEILVDTLNMKSTKVYDKVDDTRVLNTKETSLAKQKQAEVREAFSNWIFKDADRRNELVKRYNELFNSHRNMDYSELAKYLTFPGLHSSWKMRDYQKTAVARVVFGGNTLLAHGVGTGKTSEMIASAMEMKRMGITRKNVMVVPKHKVGDFRNDILKMYPEAKVLMATEKDFKKENRGKLFSKIGTNDWDIVIVGHSSFGLLPVSKETQAAYIEKEKADLEEVITSARTKDGGVRDTRFVKGLEKTLQSMESKLKALLDAPKDDTITFEELGIDGLFVDEAHNFKNLPFYTKLNLPGIKGGASKRASDLFMKTEYLRNSGGRIVFATATPVTNTISEIYNMTKFVSPETLKEAGIYSFDAWASTFGNIETKVEMSPDGKNFRTKERFAKYFNVPEMVGMFRQFADILKTSDVVKDLPKANYIDVVSPSLDIHDSYIENIVNRMKNISSGGQSKSDNMLLITSDGRAMATDLRLIASQLEGYDISDLDVESSRINKAVRNIADEYKKSNKIKGTQFVFLDFGMNANEGGRYAYDLYGDLIGKLVKEGIPESEIAKIGDYDTQTKKDDLFSKVNKGEIRVLIGSTAKMGEGMNAQERAVALHHLNAPYRPSDIEQREGRIIRYGNQNKEVNIYRYIQEKSFDSYMWQMLARKAEFINQAMSDGNVSEIEETDEFVLSAKTGMAVASGNPLILKKVEIDEEVKRLQGLKKSYDASYYEMQERLMKLPSEIEGMENLMSRVSSDIETLNKNSSEDFSIKLGKKTYDKRSDAAKALVPLVKNKYGASGSEIIGSYRGLNIKLSKAFTGSTLYLGNNAEMKIELSESAEGNITKIVNAAGRFDAYLEFLQKKQDTLKKELESVKADIDKPFKYQEQLDKAIAEQADIDAQLNFGEDNSDIVEDMDNEFEENDEDISFYFLSEEEIERDEERNSKSLFNWRRWRNVQRTDRGARRLYEDSRRNFEQSQEERESYIQKVKESGKIQRVRIGSLEIDVISESAYNEEMTAIAELNGERGMKTRFIASIPSKGSMKFGGFTLKDGTVYICYGTKSSPWKTNKHELSHNFYISDAIKVIKRAINAYMTEAEILKLKPASDRYKNYYLHYKGNVDRVYEEFVCNVMEGSETLEHPDIQKLVDAYWNNDFDFIYNYKIKAEENDVGVTTEDTTPVWLHDILDEGFYPSLDDGIYDTDIVEDMDNEFEENEIEESYSMETEEEYESKEKEDGGGHLFAGRSGRSDVQDSRKQGGGIFGKAGTLTERSREDRQATAGLLRARLLTKKTLVGKTELELIDKKAYTDDMLEIVAYNKKQGVKTFFFVGQGTRADKPLLRCNGMHRSNGEIYLSYDCKGSLTSLNRHELVHHFFNTEVMQKISQLFSHIIGNEKLNDIYKIPAYQRYLNLYDGDVSKVFEEVVADTISGINKGETHRKVLDLVSAFWNGRFDEIDSKFDEFGLMLTEKPNKNPKDIDYSLDDGIYDTDIVEDMDDEFEAEDELVPNAITEEEFEVEKTEHQNYNDNYNERKWRKIYNPYRENRGIQEGRGTSKERKFERKEGSISEEESRETLRHNGKRGWRTLYHPDRHDRAVREGRARTLEKTREERQKYAEEIVSTGGLENFEILGHSFDVVKNERLNDQMKQIASYNKQFGIQTKFYFGTKGIKNVKGAAYTDGKGTVILAYDLRKSPWDYNSHEIIHVLYNTPPIKKIRSVIESWLKENDVDILGDDRYKDYFKYHGNMEDVFQEYVCDVVSNKRTDSRTAPFSDLVNAFWSANFEYIENYGSRDKANSESLWNNKSYFDEGFYPSLDDDGIYDFGDIWRELVDEYGAIPKGEKPARDVDVPRKIDERRVVSRFARTMMEAGVTPDFAISEFEQRVLDGTMTHLEITNEAARSSAQKQIEEEGFKESLKSWDVLVDKDAVGKKQLVFGMELYNQCITNGDVASAMKIAADLTAMATSAGQTLQACRVLKLMSSDGQLYYLERSVKKLTEEFKKKLGDKFKGIELDEQLMKEFFVAEGEGAENEAYDKLCQNIADQIPATKMDKWNAWRYLAMLGNPRTHLRNIVGNAIFVPAIRIKNMVGAIGERTFGVNKEERTRSFYKTKESKEFAKADFEQMKKTLQGENAKYATTGDIESHRTIFKNKLLETLRRKNFDFLEAEDMAFLKLHYVDALARVITARGIDVNNINSETLDKIRLFAVRQAQEATYRDANELAEALNKLQEKLETGGALKRTAGVLVEGVMPFKKTPLNIAKQGVKYSPVSILTGISKTIKIVKRNGDVSVAEAIDDFSKGLTGTGLMMLGYFLARLGFLSGADDEDEKKKRFDKMVGEQSYALKIGDISYTIDWMTPSSLPLFIGQELYDLTKDEFSFRDIIDAVSRISDPLLELSVFSGISDTIDAAKYSGSNAVSAIAEDMVTSYLTQALPTVFGQISRLIDGTKRNYYYSDKNSQLPSSLQRLIGQVSSKIPFASFLFEPSVDEWGRDESYGGILERMLENTVSPGYYSKEAYTRVDDELAKLYRKTGDNSVFPTKVQKYYVSDGTYYYMNAEDYTEVKKRRGKLSFKLVKELIGSPNYKAMSDEEKIKAISKCYREAEETVKGETLEKIKRHSK